MSDLQRQIEALAKEWEDWEPDDNPTAEEIAQVQMLKCAGSRLRSILALCAPKAEGWRGPWKCEKCDMEFAPGDNLSGYTHDEMPCWAGILSTQICHGMLAPHERRKGGAK